MPTNPQLSYERFWNSSHSFRACTALGYIPLSWRVVKADFYTQAWAYKLWSEKSFHSIGLTSFLLKTTNRSVDRLHIRQSLGKIPNAFPAPYIPDLWIRPKSL
jgi:hypothetical protein